MFNDSIGGRLASRSPLLSPNQIAEMLGVNVHYVYRSLTSGELTGHKIGGRPKAPWRVRIEDVEVWVR